MFGLKNLMISNNVRLMCDKGLNIVVKIVVVLIVLVPAFVVFTNLDTILCMELTFR